MDERNKKSGLKPRKFSEVREIFDNLGLKGKWLVVTIKPSFPWPVNYQKIEYLKNEFHIIPVTKEQYPGVALNHEADDIEFDEIFPLVAKVARFISFLSWSFKSPARLSNWGHGSGIGCHTLGFGKKERDPFKVCENFQIENFPNEIEEKIQLSMSLLREAYILSSNNSRYAFIAYFRVFEALLGDAENIKKWMINNLMRINLTGSASVRFEIMLERGSPEKLVEFLYNERRCGVAHAKIMKKNFIVWDPDEDMIPVPMSIAGMAFNERRWDIGEYMIRSGINEDLEIMKSLAELCISEKLENLHFK